MDGCWMEDVAMVQKQIKVNGRGVSWLEVETLSQYLRSRSPRSVLPVNGPTVKAKGTTTTMDNDPTAMLLLI